MKTQINSPPNIGLIDGIKINYKLIRITK